MSSAAIASSQNASRALSLPENHNSKRAQENWKKVSDWIKEKRVSTLPSLPTQSAFHALSPELQKLAQLLQEVARFPGISTLGHSQNPFDFPENQGTQSAALTHLLSDPSTLQAASKLTGKPSIAVAIFHA